MTRSYQKVTLISLPVCPKCCQDIVSRFPTLELPQRCPKGAPKLLQKLPLSYLKVTESLLFSKLQTTTIIGLWEKIMNDILCLNFSKATDFFTLLVFQLRE